MHVLVNQVGQANQPTFSSSNSGLGAEFMWWSAHLYMLLFAPGRSFRHLFCPTFFCCSQVPGTIWKMVKIVGVGFICSHKASLTPWTSTSVNAILIWWFLMQLPLKHNDFVDFFSSILGYRRICTNSICKSTQWYFKNSATFKMNSNLIFCCHTTNYLMMIVTVNWEPIVCIEMFGRPK